jgi:hypothetical protein
MMKQHMIPLIASLTTGDVALTVLQVLLLLLIAVYWLRYWTHSRRPLATHQDRSARLAATHQGRIDRSLVPLSPSAQRVVVVARLLGFCCGVLAMLFFVISLATHGLGRSVIGILYANIYITFQLLSLTLLTCVDYIQRRERPARAGGHHQH